MGLPGGAPRIAVLCGVAAACALLAASEFRTWHAARIYDSGIVRPDPATGRPVIDDPVRDVPGRLPLYEAALEADPAQPLHSLRSAQILLQRVKSEPRADVRASLVGTALGRLRHAATIVPCDSRVHDAIGFCLLTTGDTEGALEASRRAIRTGPSRGFTIAPSVARCVRIWRTTRDPAALAIALEGVGLGQAVVDAAEPGDRAASPPGEPAVAALLDAPDGPSDDEVALAVGGRPDLVAVLRRVRPRRFAALGEGPR